jgi:hypothetical protein
MTRDQNVLPQYLLSLPKVFLNMVLLLEAEVDLQIDLTSRAAF